MAKGQNVAAPADDSTTTEDKPKRKVLTAAERVAKLEAQLEAAREKAAAKDTKRIGTLTSRRDKLVERRNALDVQINEITEELQLLGAFDDGTPADD